MQHDSLIKKKEDFEIQTKFGKFRLRAYLQVTNKKVHIALTKGSWKKGDEVVIEFLPRFSGDINHSKAATTF